MPQVSLTGAFVSNIDVIPPRFMPKYNGLCPTLRYDFGETYGNGTAAYYQDYRSEVLRKSKSAYAIGGNFPTLYSHNPDLVINARDRVRKRFHLTPNYSLLNVQNDRVTELKKFKKELDIHREYYKDKTGSLQRVNTFILPKLI